MRFEILTIFPEFFPSALGATLIGKALRKGIIEVVLTDVRSFTEDRHRMVDDTPYGGGQGMVMKPEPLVAAIEAARAAAPATKVVQLTPRGEPLTQRLADELARESAITLVCGHYEGIDERVQDWIDRDVSIGDYVLAGGESAALVVLDAVSRLVPGFVGNADSLAEESFREPLLEYPQYTRPETFRGRTVPEVLRSGHHGAIARWRRKQALRITLERRPDLLGTLSAEDRKLVAELEDEDS